MRTLLLWFGWLSVVGSLLDGAITAFLIIQIGLGDAPVAMSVDAHLFKHLRFLYWIKDVGYFLLPDGFVDWIFALPALVYFPVRVVTSIIIGALALNAAANMNRQHA